MASSVSRWSNKPTTKQIFDRNQTLAEFVSKIAKLPLAYHPGTTWEYSHSTDVLGRIVEVVSGSTLDQFVADRIAKPLGLSDTGFYVPTEKLDRLAETQIDPTTGKRWPTFDVTNRPNWLAGDQGWSQRLRTTCDLLRCY